MNITTDQVNNISRLPTSCKEDYVVRISNTDSEYDDYYAKFKPSIPGNDGDGVWEETRKPGIPHDINSNFMPHVMRREVVTENSVIRRRFVVSPLSYASREVGDNITNPAPSFIGKRINKMVLFRNRLGFLSDENVILSRPGEFTNFWNGSALGQVPNDPIDISDASTQAAVLFDAI